MMLYIQATVQIQHEQAAQSHQGNCGQDERAGWGEEKGTVSLPGQFQRHGDNLVLSRHLTKSRCSVQVFFCFFGMIFRSWTGLWVDECLYVPQEAAHFLLVCKELWEARVAFEFPLFRGCLWCVCVCAWRGCYVATYSGLQVAWH